MLEQDLLEYCQRIFGNLPIRVESIYTVGSEPQHVFPYLCPGGVVSADSPNLEGFYFGDLTFTNGDAGGGTPTFVDLSWTWGEGVLSRAVISVQGTYRNLLFNGFGTNIFYTGPFPPYVAFKGFWVQMA